MNILHEKSPCCQAKIYKNAGKRKQCSGCKKIWTNWKKKRGRKTRRPDKKLITDILVNSERASHLVHHKRNVSQQTISQRLKKVMPLCKRTIPYPSGWLIGVADAIWFSFKKKRWTLYIISIRSITGGPAHYLEPVLLPGRETGAGWRELMRSIPEEIDSRILALVSDGFRGLQQIAKERKWIHQLCHLQQLIMNQNIL